MVTRNCLLVKSTVEQSLDTKTVHSKSCGSMVRQFFLVLDQFIILIQPISHDMIHCDDSIIAPRLIGTGGCWFLLDVAFYGLKLFSGPIFAESESYCFNSFPGSSLTLFKPLFNHSCEFLFKNLQSIQTVT